VTRNPSLQAGPCLAGERDGEDDAGEVRDRERDRDADVRGQEPPVRGERAEQFPEALGGEKRGAQSRGDEAGKEEQRERPQPADDRVHDGRGGRDSGERGEGEGHTRTDFAPDKRFVVVRASPAPRFDGSPR